MVWCSHLFKNFPQFVVIHTVKGFGIDNKAEIDVFLELSCFFNDTVDVGNLISGSLPFLNPSLTSGHSYSSSGCEVQDQGMSQFRLMNDLSSWLVDGYLLIKSSQDLFVFV